MKKMTSLLLCVLLLLSMVPVAAAEDVATTPTGETTQTEPPHQHSWTTTNSATCIAGGRITKTCNDCGATEDGGESGALGHTWTDVREERPATCQQEGLVKTLCTVCQTEGERAIPKQNHTFSEWNAVGNFHSRKCSVCLVEESGTHTGTWTNNGTDHSRICTTCNARETTLHNLKDQVTKKPTCKEEGTRTRTCTACSYSEDFAIEKLTSHTYDSACDPECNVCGKTREISHNYTVTWSYNYKGHWHECTKCDERKDEEKHISGPAATEKEAQICLRCGYVVTPKKEHVHSYGEEWTSDDMGHWHACTGCDEEKEYAAHRYDDGCDDTCNVCGYERTDSHTYDENWQTTAFEHWNICSVCGEESKHEKHVPGEAATDKSGQLCTVCAYELAPALEHSHDFGPRWFQDQDTHWQDCACGELSVPVSHVWNQGKETRKGIVTFTCVDCGLERNEKIQASFPWLLVILIVLAVGCLVGIVVLVILLKRGDFEEEETNDAEEEEEYPEEDDEDKMIDDYFASLGEDLYE